MIQLQAFVTLTFTSTLAVTVSPGVAASLVMFVELSGKKAVEVGGVGSDTAVMVPRKVNKPQLIKKTP